MLLAAKGSNGSSSSLWSSGRIDERSDELGVSARGSKALSGVSGAAIASLDVGR